MEEIKREIQLKNEEINNKEAEILALTNVMKDKMSRENISSRNLREACQNLKIPYTPPGRHNFDEDFTSIVSSAPYNNSI
jgi:hypothetical protein